MDILGLNGILARLSALEAKGTPVCDHSDFTIRMDVLQAELKLLKISVEATEEDVRSMIDAVHVLSDEDGRLKLAIEEGILKTNRAERRVRTAVSRARKELHDLGLEDPTLEAEAGELRDTDGDRGDESGVRLLPSTVEPSSETASSIPGVSIEQIRRMRGL